MSPSCPPQAPVKRPPMWYQVESQPDIVVATVLTQPVPERLQWLSTGGDAWAQPVHRVCAAFAAERVMNERLLDQTHSVVVQVTRVHCGVLAQVEGAVQEPPMHRVPPVHTCPQVPQLFRSVASVASQPFAVFPSQSP